MMSNICNVCNSELAQMVLCRYLEGLVAAASGSAARAQIHSMAALAASEEELDCQIEANAAVAVGMLMCFFHHGVAKQEEGWDLLTR